MSEIIGSGTLAFFKELLLRTFSKMPGVLFVLLVNYTYHTCIQ